eukprot:m.917298 g.917298  ORF g.917298 m.917298 type:complete len:185 (+) comp23738_c0_seq51:840-1394(+)
MQGRAPLYCADHTIETNGKIMRLHATQTYCSGSEPNERCRGSSSHTRATVPPNRRIGEFSARTVHGNVPDIPKFRQKTLVATRKELCTRTTRFAAFKTCFRDRRGDAFGNFSIKVQHWTDAVIVRVFAECAGVPDSTPVREQNSSPAGTSGHIRKVTRSPVNVGVFFLITRPTTYVASGNVYLQ